ncbi:MAG: nuclear transport factor 2 family protein [Deltaproteobacteria bacterium]|nr:nuclear transport factor 2 family protein [Deltaproteobacteria bacterium]
MHDNMKLIKTFYTSFQKLDSRGMVKCYHEDIEFSDPVFPALKGNAAKAMWKMLCLRATELEITFGNISANDAAGTAHWEAKYKFITTGRQVHNKIDAEFEFQDGKIIRHRDSFDFWRWSKMAFGPIGWMLGATPFFRKKVQKRVAVSLENFMKNANIR